MTKNYPKVLKDAPRALAARSGFHVNTERKGTPTKCVTLDDLKALKGFFD